LRRFRPLFYFILILALLHILKQGFYQERAITETSFPSPASSDHTFFVEPEDGREPVVAALREAKEYIWLKCYLLSDDKIIDELIRAKQRGAEVKVILEEEPYGGSKLNYKTKRYLEREGILFGWASPRFALTHEKSIVIDHKKAFIMTLNLCRSAFTNNREYGVITTCQEEVEEVANLFEADWKREKYYPQEPNLVVSPQNSRRKILGLIKRAKEKIWLAQLLMEDEEIIAALRRATKRGVRVKLLLASPDRVPINKELPFREEGIQVRYLRKPHLHAKLIDFDSEIIFIGSQNCSAPSLDLNRELGILLTDKDLITRLEEIFIKDWEKGEER